jgi:hypothetical protein
VAAEDFLVRADVIEDPAVRAFAAALSVSAYEAVGILFVAHGWWQRHGTKLAGSQAAHNGEHNAAITPTSHPLGLVEMEHYIGVIGVAKALMSCGLCGDGDVAGSLFVRAPQGARATAFNAKRQREFQARKREAKAAARAGSKPVMLTGVQDGPHKSVCVFRDIREENPSAPRTAITVTSLPEEDGENTHTLPAEKPPANAVTTMAANATRAEKPARAKQKPVAKDPVTEAVLRWHRGRNTAKDLFDKVDPTLKERQAYDALLKICNLDEVDEVIDELNRLLDSHWADCGSFIAAMNTKHAIQAVKNVRAKRSKESGKQRAIKERERERDDSRADRERDLVYGPKLDAMTPEDRSRLEERIISRMGAEAWASAPQFSKRKICIKELAQECAS